MSNSITFQTEDIDFVFPDQEQTNDWITAVIDQENGQLNFLNYIFCSDNYLLKLNQEYLQHDTLTDIITFHYSEEVIESDIFISVERVRENALGLGVAFETELKRVMVHGVLHLLGYPDKTEEEKERMRKKEDEMLGMRQLSEEDL